MYVYLLQLFLETKTQRWSCSSLENYIKLQEMNTWERRIRKIHAQENNGE